ncbi:MAG TPA: hypothetical protein VEW94_11330, partial [Chloroflexia bacterium]|nr:hypothetical protein [Chloroflexia bacterium]
MRQNLFALLAGILLITILAGYINMSDSIGVGDFKRDTRTRLGLDLQGGLQLVLQAEPRGDQTSIASDQLEAARVIIEGRANGTGAAEPVVQTAGGDRILVELPGIENIEEATNIIRETAFLEYISSGDTPLLEGTRVCTTEGCPRPEQLRAQPTPTAAVAITSTQTVTGSATVTSTGTITPGATITATAATTNTAAVTPVATPTPPLNTYDTIITGEDIDGSKVAVTYDEAN